MRAALVLLLLASLAHATAPPAPWKLTGEGRRALDALTADLVDPKGAERVEANQIKRHNYGNRDRW